MCAMLSRMAYSILYRSYNIQCYNEGTQINNEKSKQDQETTFFSKATSH